MRVNIEHRSAGDDFAYERWKLGALERRRGCGVGIVFEGMTILLDLSVLIAKVLHEPLHVNG